MSTGHAYRAFQTTQVVGTSAHADLDSPAPAGFQKLVAAIKQITGVTTGPWSVEATITNHTLGNPSGTDWEVWETNLEEGTGGGGLDRIMRNGTIKASSNGGAAVNWGSGFKDVFIAANAKKGYALLDVPSTAGFLKRVSAESYEIKADPLPVANGGTAAASAADARTNLAVVGTGLVTTRGDLFRRGASAVERLPVGSTDHVVGFDGTDTLFRRLLAAWMDYSTAVAPLSTGTLEAVLDQIGGFFAATTYRGAASGDVAIANPTTTWAHGLGVRPRSIDIHLHCTTNNLTYVVDDYYYIGGGNVGTAGVVTAIGIGVRMDATNVYIDQFAAANTISIVQKGGGGEDTITDASWRWNIYVEA